MRRLGEDVVEFIGIVRRLELQQRQPSPAGDVQILQYTLTSDFTSMGSFTFNSLDEFLNNSPALFGDTYATFRVDANYQSENYSFPSGEKQTSCGRNSLPSSGTRKSSISASNDAPDFWSVNRWTFCLPHSQQNTASRYFAGQTASR